MCDKLKRHKYSEKSDFRKDLSIYWELHVTPPSHHTQGMATVNSSIILLCAKVFFQIQTRSTGHNISENLWELHFLCRPFFTKLSANIWKQKTIEKNKVRKDRVGKPSRKLQASNSVRCSEKIPGIFVGLLFFCEHQLIFLLASTKFFRLICLTWQSARFKTCWSEVQSHPLPSFFFNFKIFEFSFLVLVVCFLKTIFVQTHIFSPFC